MWVREITTVDTSPVLERRVLFSWERDRPQNVIPIPVLAQSVPSLAVEESGQPSLTFVRVARSAYLPASFSSFPFLPPTPWSSRPHPILYCFSFSVFLVYSSSFLLLGVFGSSFANMGLKLGSSWSTPRGWRMISLTLFALTLLLVIPLHQLSSDSPGVYSQVSKYLKHEGIVYDVEDGFIANLNETETEQVVGENANGVENGSGGQQPSGAHQGQATGDGGKEAQNTDGKPVEGQHAQGGNNNNGQGVGGPIQEGGKLGTNEGNPEGKENSQDGDSEDDDEVEPVQPPKFIVHPNPEPTTTTSQKPPAPAPAKENDTGKEKENDTEKEKEQEKEKENNNDDNKGNENNKDNGDDKNKQETPNAGDKPSDSAAIGFPSNPSNPAGFCDGFPDLNGITLVMKTGATEVFSKLPAHLLTSLQCIKDVLIFSDLVRPTIPFSLLMS